MQWRISELTDSYLTAGHPIGMAIKLAVQDVTQTGLNIEQPDESLD